MKPPRHADGGIVVVLSLNKAEATKLQQLAEARQRSPEDCLRDMIATCQPGGSGWVHPSVQVKKEARG